MTNNRQLEAKKTNPIPAQSIGKQHVCAADQRKDTDKHAKQTGRLCPAIPNPFMGEGPMVKFSSNEKTKRTQSCHSREGGNPVLQNKANLNECLIKMGGTFKRSLWVRFTKRTQMESRNYEKTKRTQNVAQPPSAVVIYSGPKGRPHFCHFPFPFCLFIKTPVQYNTCIITEITHKYLQDKWLWQN
jgi:hypothetical protein